MDSKEKKEVDKDAIQDETIKNNITSFAQAKKIIQDEKDQRANECLKRLLNVLEDHSCSWEVVNKLNGKVIESVIMIVPKEI